MDFFRKVGSIFFGLVYLSAGLAFIFYPISEFGNRSTMGWLIATFHVGNPVVNARWIIGGSVVFLLTGVLLLVTPFLNLKKS